jgi:hypothetical protein
VGEGRGGGGDYALFCDVVGAVDRWVSLLQVGARGSWVGTYGGLEVVVPVVVPMVVPVVVLLLVVVVVVPVRLRLRLWLRLRCSCGW